MAGSNSSGDWQGALGQTWLRESDGIGALQAPVTPLLMRRAGLGAGDRVLDVGCGTGGSTRAAASLVQPGGSVTGIDVSAEMLMVARGRAVDGITYLEADAEAHAFPSAGFDRILSQFGVMFFGDGRAALANLRAATRPGGTLAVVAYGGPEANPWFSLPRAAAMAELADTPGDPANAPPNDPDAPGPMRFRDIARTVALIEAAGWLAVSGEATALDLTPAGTLADVAALATRIGPAAGLLRQRGADDALRDRVAARIRAAFAPFARPEGVRIPAVVNIFTATAP
jgi:SAM-dependent methyltransferase